MELCFQWSQQFFFHCSFVCIILRAKIFSGMYSEGINTLCVYAAVHT